VSDFSVLPRQAKPIIEHRRISSFKHSSFITRLYRFIS